MTGHPHPRSHGAEGYTLTELLLVLGIIAIVTGLGGIWFSSQLPHYHLNGAARQLRADLSAARAQAVRQRNEVRVIFTSPWRYDILDDDNNNGVADPGERIESRSIREDFPDVTLHAGANPIFHPRGTATSVTTVTVTNPSGAQHITIRLTGRTHITSPP